MGTLARVGVLTTTLLLLWTAGVVIGTLEGWFRAPLAPRGETGAFLDAVVAKAVAENRGNVALALIEGGNLYGEHAASIGEPVDTDTVFQVASLSKWVTAWGVMALVEEGRLDLDAPVGTYLTRWTLPPSPFDHDGVTVRRLLSHTAGLTDGLGYAGFAPGTPAQTLEESLARTGDADPGASGLVRVGMEPGSSWTYSGGGYTLLQLLVEERSGEPFEAYMQRVVFRPLGMEHTTFEWTPERGTRLATFYDADSTPAVHRRYTAVAAASLYTSVSDLVRFIQAHLPGADGERAGRGVLNPATLERMRRPEAFQLGQAIWGLGTILYAPNGRGGFVIGHDGNNTPAINTAARFDPSTGNGIVVLETGAPLLATQLAGEWVFWETGNPDLLAVLMAAEGALTTVLFGWGLIVASGLLIGWRLRRAASAGATPG